LVRTHPAANAASGTFVGINEDRQGMASSGKYIPRYYDALARPKVNAVTATFAPVVVDNNLTFNHITQTYFMI
jgi:hypothetical protein